MNKIILATLFAFATLWSQETFYSSYMELELTTRDFPNVEPVLRSLVKASGAQVTELNQDREHNSVTMTLSVNSQQFDSLSAQLPSLATVAKNHITSEDLGKELMETQEHLTWTKNLAADNSVQQNDSARQAFRTSIHEQELTLRTLQQRAVHHTIHVELSEDNPFQYSYDTDNWFSFINMPGVEAIAFWPQQPAKNRTMDRYQGFSLRYMFTQGKSYVNLGVMKGHGTVTSDSLINDIFLYDWGTEFYPRHLGKGKRRFFNLYSGFQFGGMLLGSNDDFQNIFTLEAHVGVELLKLQYLIWDVHTGYLFPINPSWNRHMRGVEAGTAFNFVF